MSTKVSGAIQMDDYNRMTNFVEILNKICYIGVA